MLALKLGMSLVSSNRVGGWSPDDESSLEAWYQNAVGITLNGSDVSRWGIVQVTLMIWIKQLQLSNLLMLMAL